MKELINGFFTPETVKELILKVGPTLIMFFMIWWEIRDIKLALDNTHIELIRMISIPCDHMSE